jgi:hypothetical protein
MEDERAQRQRLCDARSWDELATVGKVGILPTKALRSDPSTRTNKGQSWFLGIQVVKESLRKSVAGAPDLTRASHRILHMPISSQHSMQFPSSRSPMKKTPVGGDCASIASPSLTCFASISRFSFEPFGSGLLLQTLMSEQGPDEA